MEPTPKRRRRPEVEETDEPEFDLGHNNPPDDDEVTADAQTVATGQLRAFIERVERLEEEKKTIADDIKEVYAEAKGTGFDTKALRTLIRLRKMDPDELAEADAILDLYKAALGMA